MAITLGQYSAPRASLEVDIYEADSEIRTVGAGITVWPRTWTVMRHLDLYEDLRDVTVSARSSSEAGDFGFDYSKYASRTDKMAIIDMIKNRHSLRGRLTNRARAINTVLSSRLVSRIENL